MTTAGDSSGRNRPFLVALAAVAFALNWLWEMLQMPAYRETAGRSWRETLRPCTLAALGDVAVTFIILGLGVLASGRRRWGPDGGWNVYAAAALLGMLFAVTIEWRAKAFGRWSYAESMRVVPGLGVGLWPVLQLGLLTPASFWVAARVAWIRRAENSRGEAHERDRHHHGQ